MKPEKPVHFVEWKKISDADFISTVRKLAEWGVRDIVAHPRWGMRDMEEPGYLHSVMEELKRAGLAAPACHACPSALGGLPAACCSVPDYRRCSDRRILAL